MNSIQIPVGISDFERIRENNYYYIDKSGLLIDMLKEEMDQVMLITRPRRLNNLGLIEPSVRHGWFFRNYPLLLLYPIYLNFASSNCLPHLPYIVRFIIFNLLFVPSTNPLL